MSDANDEQQIREVIATWIKATTAGDVNLILELMTEDVVFLRPGQEPIRGREAFARGFRGALQHFRIEGTPEIQEIQVSGDWAWCWNYLTVTLAPLQGGVLKANKGPVLSVFRKGLDSKWRISRDANMLT